MHAEATPHLHRLVQHIRSLGKRAGVALNPHTSLQPLDVILPDLSLVLIMSVNPGFGGQQFIEAVVPKIRALRDEITRRRLNVDIEVDGGITPETARIVVDAGANVLVAGSSVFKSPDYRQAIAALRVH